MRQETCLIANLIAAITGGDMKQAKIYLRRNGKYGSSYKGVPDTGHEITEDSGKFTVFSLDDEFFIIANAVSRDEAEKAIARDWDYTP